MENQHQKITGYRELSAVEIDTMNNIKALAEEVGDLVQELRDVLTLVDQRWVELGAADLQTGFMALVRSVAQPTTF